MVGWFLVSPGLKNYKQGKNQVQQIVDFDAAMAATGYGTTKSHKNMHLRKRVMGPG